MLKRLFVIFSMVVIFGLCSNIVFADRVYRGQNGVEATPPDDTVLGYLKDKYASTDKNEKDKESKESKSKLESTEKVEKPKDQDEKADKKEEKGFFEKILDAIEAFFSLDEEDED